jgi:uncharacterized membrane protein YvbJ
MAYCPNCCAPIAKDAEDCDVCGTSFGSDTWLPMDSLPAAPRRRLSLRRLVRLALVSVLFVFTGLFMLRGLQDGLDTLVYVLPFVALLVAGVVLFCKPRA